MPVDDDASVAWLAGHVLEFVGDDGEPRLAWEVRGGDEYRLVVTTEAGLYRYDLGDVVRVSGWFMGAPRLVFVRKAGNVLNAMGEKVTEDQVVDRRARGVPEALACPSASGGARSRAPRGGGGRGPGLKVRGARAVRRDAPRRQRGVRRAPHQRAHRAATGTVVRPGYFGAWREARVRAGAPDAQVKDPVVLDADRWDSLVGG